MQILELVLALYSFPATRKSRAESCLLTRRPLRFVPADRGSLLRTPYSGILGIHTSMPKRIAPAQLARESQSLGNTRTGHPTLAVRVCRVW